MLCVLDCLVLVDFTLVGCLICSVACAGLGCLSGSFVCGLIVWFVFVAVAIAGWCCFWVRFDVVRCDVVGSAVFTACECEFVGCFVWFVLLLVAFGCWFLLFIVLAVMVG